LEQALGEALVRQLADHHACGALVPARDVETVRRTDPQFAEWPVAEVGKYFNVDLVLHVQVVEFRFRDHPTSNAYHGYAEARVRLVSSDQGEQVWPVLASARLMTAETMPDVEPETPADEESVLLDGFADKVARLFYTYKTEDLPLRPKVK
jgi:hypothetical protein